MLFTVDAFYNTNFDTVNIPIDASFLLNNFVHKSFPSLDVLQCYFLGYVDIRAEWEEIKNCDYIRLRRDISQPPEQSGTHYERAYYAVTDITMLSGDVCRLSIVFDAVTTFGGMSQLDIFGVTVRVSVMEWQEENYLQATSEVFFENGDPLLAPSDPLLVTYTSVDSSSPQALGQGGNFIESTIDLATLGGSSYSDAKTYIDATAQTYSTFPKLPAAQNTLYSFDNGAIQLSRQTGLFKDTGVVKDGLMAARACGIEGSIINQVEIPSNYIDATIDTDGRVTRMEGARGEKSVTDTGIDDNLNQAVNLKRLTYGDYCKIGIVTATGASFTARVEELYYKTGHIAIVQYMVDARPDGAPYYKLCTKQNYSPVTANEKQNPDFFNFQGALKGSNWKKIPLVFYEKSGSLLDTLNYNNTQDMNNMSYDYGKAQLDAQRAQLSLSHRYSVAGFDMQEQALQQSRGQATMNAGLGVLGSIGAVGLSAATGNIPGAALGVAGIIGSAGNFAYTLNQQDIQQNQLQLQRAQELTNYQQSMRVNKMSLGQLSEQYNAQKAIDKMNFAFSQNVVVPTMFFSYNSDVIRDFCGNGALVWRTHYSDYDKHRISILLNAYGMYHRTELRKELFTKANTNYFTYFEAGSISVGGTDYYHEYPESSGNFYPEHALPRWAVQAITLQLQNGVRVWHTLGDKPIGHSSYYENMINYRYKNEV